ncbi:MAG: response regulator transcription factor [Bacteroidetes bacterium]|nr:response regulator transcription factor [Bacteroidota bacterium]MBK8658729.1 response regulator transcription factor [Bacteroidota bacterium]
MKIVIVEDEQLIAKNLARMIKQIEPEAEIIQSLDSVSASVKWLKANPQPDLFFMDIQLSDGISFDIFDQVNIDKPVIFTTAYNEYAIRAFKVNSVDYLLKPVDQELLRSALEKYKLLYKQGNSDASMPLREFAKGYKQDDLPRYKERFLVHYKAGMLPVPATKVSCFLKDSIIYLITTENEKLVTDYSTLDEIEEVVNPEQFFRANRQTLIQIHEVDAYKKHDTGKIELQLKSSPNFKVDVSREKANEFIQWLDR